MSNNVEQAIKRIQELQQTFANSLSLRINELEELIQQLDKCLPPDSVTNQVLLKGIHDSAHKLAGASGTFQFTEVYEAAKKLENFCSMLLEPSAEPIDHWLSQLEERQQAINLASTHKKKTLSLSPKLAHTEDRETANFQQIKIVLVDDDELVTSLIQEQAKSFGYHISSIIDPNELSDFLQHNKPEVILMDIVFPQHSFTGIDLVKQLQAENKIHCPVIFLSNQEGFKHRLAAVRSGGNGYLAKPVNIIELVEVLDRYSHPNSQDSYRALIIDDDPMVTDYFKEILEHHHFTCQIVSDPFIATTKLIEFRPNLILLDINMPKCNGFEIAAVIRQDNRFTHIPIIFLTTDNNHQREIEAIKAGGDHILNKNTEIDKFITYVNSHSQRSKELHILIDRLRKDELRFQAVSHSTHDAIITLNGEGLIILWNAGAEHIFGYQALEVIGQPIDIIIPSQHQEGHQRGFRNLVKNNELSGQRSIESEVITKAQKLVAIELSYTKWQSGNDQFFTSIIRDISGRKAIEKELNNQKENLKAIVNNSVEGIITINDLGVIETANPKAHRVFAYADNELIGQPIELLLPCIERYSQDAFFKRLENSDKVREVNGVRKGGENIPMALSLAPMVLDGKKKYVGTFHDIRERKAIMQALKLAKQEAETANNAKSQFLSTMSHELRTPLNVILGFTQLLQDDFSETFEREQKDYLNRIDSSGLHLLELINDVLDLSTIESGKTNLNIESVDLVGLVNESLELIVPQAYKAQITLENQLLNKEPSYIKADASRLHQVLANLLSNAIKYNWANGIISVWLAQQNGKVRLFIKNTGLGIPENKIADLFQPFQRLAADRASIEGTGIGLTITKMLVELMGGKIGVENDEGDSCTFWIEWALQESTVAPKELMRESLIVDSEPTHAAETGVNILYIEDNPSNRLLMKKMITRRTAFTYYEAKTGKEGAQIALQLQPNIILLDINLPDMTGIEVFEYLQENNLSKMTKVIAVSANAMQNDIDKGKAIGFFDYITKPIDQKQLFACIELALN